jgi:hypothetical protein
MASNELFMNICFSIVDDPIPFYSGFIFIYMVEAHLSILEAFILDSGWAFLYSGNAILKNPRWIKAKSAFSKSLVILFVILLFGRILEYFIFASLRSSKIRQTLSFLMRTMMAFLTFNPRSRSGSSSHFLNPNSLNFHASRITTLYQYQVMCNQPEIIDLTNKLGTPLPGMSIEAHFALFKQYVQTPTYHFEKRRLLRALLSLDNEPYESDKEREQREVAEALCLID